MTTFLEGGESSAAPDDQRVFELAGECFERVHMTRPLERITARGTVLRRRRAAVTALSAAAVAAVAALTAAAVLPPSGPGTSSAAAAGTAGAPRMADADWTVTAVPGGGYSVEITALGDAAGLNETLVALGVEIKVVETPADSRSVGGQSVGGQSGCPAAGGSAPAVGATVTTAPTLTVPASSSASTSATDGTSPSSTGSATQGAGGSPTLNATAGGTGGASPSAMTLPTPTPTPVSFAVSGTPAAFTFRGLPRQSAVSFVSLEGRGGSVLGTVRISDACLPVTDPR